MARQDDAGKTSGGVRPGYWFAPKAFGFGARPVTWQGWAMMLGYAALLLATLRLLNDNLARTVIAVVLTFTFVYFSWIKTDGGWRWHWHLVRRD